MKTAKILAFIGCLLIASCGIKNGNGEMECELIPCKGLDAKPIFLHFVTDDVGYAFVNVGYMYMQAAAVIYKTMDGGKNWNKVKSVENYLFSGTKSVAIGENIYCYINSEDDYSVNRIVCFNCQNNTVKVSDFVAQAIGDVWEQNGKICSNVYLDSVYCLLQVDTSLNNYVVKKRTDNKEMSDGFCCNKSNIYSITYDNQLVVQSDSCVKKIPICNPQCITKIAEGKVLVAANTSRDTITLFEYSSDSNRLRATHTIPGYNIAKEFQMDKANKTLVGFVGNIKGHLVEYDMVCCPIETQQLSILTLLIPYSVTPNDITEKYMFVFGDRHSLQRYTLPR